MMNIIICILTVAVALLITLCCTLFYIIGRKDDRLARLTDELLKQKEDILELELELQRNSDIIRAIGNKPPTGSDE